MAQKKISRQLKWQREQARKGNCRICGKKRSRKSKAFCRTHLLDIRRRSYEYFLAHRQSGESIGIEP